MQRDWRDIWIYVSGCGVALSILLWTALSIQEKEHLRDEVHSEAVAVELAFKENLNQTVLALRRMARRWEARDGTPRREWEEEAHWLYLDMPGYQVIEWVDTTHYVRWLEPLQGNEIVRDADLAYEAERRSALFDARDNRVITLSDPVELRQGGMGLLIVVPLFPPGGFDGYIVGVLDVERYFEAVFPDEANEGYGFAVVHDEAEIYADGRGVETYRARWEQYADFDLYGQHWRISAWPVPSVLAEKRSHLPEVGLLFGLCLSFLGGFLLRENFRVRRVSAHLERLNETLEQEIVERHAIERALRESEERFGLAIEGLNSGIWDWIDVREDDEWWSPRFYQLLGFAPGEIEASLSTFRSLLHPDDRERAFALVKAHFEGTGVFEIDYRLRMKDGTYRWFDARAALQRDEQGRPRRMVGSITDIHGRKLAEAGLQHYAAVLKQSNEDLEQFAYIASHDLQEPLRKIQTYGDRLKKYADRFDDKGTEYLDRMQAAVRRMQTLIQDLLSLSRVSNKAIEFVATDLSQLAHEAAVNLEASIEASGGRVDIETLATVDADPSQIRQLLQNLIGNALKFHKPGEPPRVRVYGHPVEAGAGVPLYELCVEDLGIGFDEKYLDRIFKPFERLHGRNEYEGTGIGMAICKKIIDRHGGTITARSAPDRGTTFIVRLPVRRDALSRHRPVPPMTQAIEAQA